MCLVRKGIWFLTKFLNSSLHFGPIIGTNFSLIVTVLLFLAVFFSFAKVILSKHYFGKTFLILYYDHIL